MGTQNGMVLLGPKQMFKLIEKKMLINLRSNSLLNWTYRDLVEHLLSVGSFQIV